MRAFGFLGTVITLAIGMYLYSIQIKTILPSAATGNREDATTIVGVKNDLISIATAERGYQASQGKYASLEELINGNYLTIKSERPPYIYNVETSGNSFRATATRSIKGSPAQLWISDDMQVQASD